MSRTPSLGLPNTDCQEGLVYPAQLPPEAGIPEVVGEPVAQLLGPPLPEPVVSKAEVVFHG
jgi:hypothetical protein